MEIKTDPESGLKVRLAEKPGCERPAVMELHPFFPAQGGLFADPEGRGVVHHDVPGQTRNAFALPQGHPGVRREQRGSQQDQETYEHEGKIILRGFTSKRILGAVSLIRQKGNN
jgi:hypothetical protein